MRAMIRRLVTALAGSALAAATLAGPTLAATDLHVCTWLTQSVGAAVGTVSAAPGSVLGPNNGGQPGGDKGPFPIYFTSDGTLLSSVSTESSSCSG